MKNSLRKPSKEQFNVTFEEVQQEPPLWKSPLTWLCAVAGVLLLGVPVVIDRITHRVNSAFLVDVSLSSRRLSRNHRQITQFIVILAGSLTFSVAPQLLAKQAGRGPWAISAGLLGGGLASFYAHTNATKVLAGIKLKQNTQNTRQAILDIKK